MLLKSNVNEPVALTLSKKYKKNEEILVTISSTSVRELPTSIRSLVLSNKRVFTATTKLGDMRSWKSRNCFEQNFISVTELGIETYLDFSFRFWWSAILNTWREEYNTMCLFGLLVLTFKKLSGEKLTNQ